MPLKGRKTKIVRKEKSQFKDIVSNYPSFPQLTSKENLECNILEQDHLFLIPGLLSEEECKTFVAFIDKLPLEATPPNKRGEAARVNHRIAIRSSHFAQHLFSVLKHHLPDLPLPASASVRANISTSPHSLNSNIRLYRYSEGEYFSRHYDDSVKDPDTGAQSEWTLLIYLTGEAQGVVGGQTVFYRAKQGEIVVPLTHGTALLHRHGHECMLHEARPVIKGVKYVLRSDLMFKR